ncbi:MAG: ATP-dependent endonuclease, partial [Bacteroidetes bacterium]
QSRMNEGKKQILSYAKETGASFNKATPNFEGSINESDLFAALKLIIEYETGIKIPATHNGLGYNNLIYMSLLLAKMQVDSDGSYLGSNAKVFPILAIEEPEAHLHPSMQYKFLKFLRENKDKNKRARQIFITTHSTNLTAAVSLDELICLYPINENLSVGYPGKVFTSDDIGKKSKAYVQRFLDATKSDMLFAQKVILVEGLSEQILVPVFAKYLGKKLEDEHITVISVGGRYFDHFLKLFDTPNPNTIPKKLACITDRDPERKNKIKGYSQKIYPFELHLDDANYEYKINASEQITLYQSHSNIRFFSQDSSKGKTFEYDIVLHNPGAKLILTDSLSNKPELEELFQMYKDQKTLTELIEKLRSSEENDKIIEGINANILFNEEEKKKALLASRYLKSLSKGEYALELSYVLEKNISSNQSAEAFQVPTYIKEVIEWIWQ